MYAVRAAASTQRRARYRLAILSSVNVSITSFKFNLSLISLRTANFSFVEV
jgi:hypothetical protein